MLRRGIRRVLPRRDSWHALQEYALGDTNQEEFRLLRARDSAVSALVSSTSAPQKAIDWTSWEAKISNKEVLQCLKDFHTQQSALLDSVVAQDHLAIVKDQKAGWELFDTAVKSCEKSVEKSEDILKNGARALWISFQNPPISLLSQSEWLDSDQYWQAFVEKHHFYHNHLCSAVEDPESKEYDAKQKAEITKKWETFDGRGTTRQNNKLLYQRPSFEYYDVFRGPLIEHMIFYLTKTGGDARMFPENMPVQWFSEIYDLRFKIYNVLQRRKRLEHEATVAREKHHDFHPHDLDHDGEAHFSKLIAKETAMTELTAGRLMGNYILFSDAYVPVQTGMAFYKALQMDEGKGTFYSLGGDVHCLFYKPAGEALAMPGPSECFQSLADYTSMTGRRFEVGYAAALEAFTEVLESRKEGLGGCWFTAPGESSKEAFMRRLKTSDPAYAIYEAYATEHGERWAAAKTLSLAEAMAEMPEIERKYKLECAEYDSVLYGVSEELAAAAKLEQEQLAKLADVGELQALLDSGALVAVEGGAAVASAEVVSKSAEEFESQRDKAVDSIMATKLPALDKKK
mmetsp:Transcript_49097/g.107239  ORF Transcript_49097/g.107239 Transcript_49097/m.107239 type:complete len:571 (+) Transcript_49097:82-1794(+)